MSKIRYLLNTIYIIYAQCQLFVKHVELTLSSVRQISMECMNKILMISFYHHFNNTSKTSYFIEFWSEVLVLCILIRLFQLSSRRSRLHE